MVNILQGHKQERGCLVYFVHLLAVWWAGTQNAPVYCIFTKESCSEKFSKSVKI